MVVTVRCKNFVYMTTDFSVALWTTYALAVCGTYHISKHTEWQRTERFCRRWWHYCDAIMGIVASQITSLTIVYTTVYSDADHRKHQSSAPLAFVWGIHRTKGQLRGKCFHFMTSSWYWRLWLSLSQSAISDSKVGGLLWSNRMAKKI